MRKYIIIGITGIIIMFSSRYLARLFPDNWYENAQMLILALGSMITGASFMSYDHERKMKKDVKYRYEVNDERNIMIREKSAYMVNCINMLLIAGIGIVFLMLDFQIAALVVIGLLIIQPILMIVSSSRISKKV